jgi:hypothetical protein
MKANIVVTSLPANIQFTEDVFVLRITLFVSDC